MSTICTTLLLKIIRLLDRSSMRDHESVVSTLFRFVSLKQCELDWTLMQLVYVGGPCILATLQSITFSDCRNSLEVWREGRRAEDGLTTQTSSSCALHLQPWGVVSDYRPPIVTTQLQYTTYDPKEIRSYSRILEQYSRAAPSSRMSLLIVFKF
jgi:hypothetical protein